MRLTSSFTWNIGSCRLDGRDEVVEHVTRFGEPRGQPDALDRGPPQHPSEHLERQAVAVADRAPCGPSGAVEQDCDERTVGGVRVGDDEVDAELGEPDVGPDHVPAHAQRVGDLLAMPVDDGRAPAGDRDGPGACRGEVEVGAQVLDADALRLLGAQLLGVERREHDDLAPRTGDRHVEPTFPAVAVERPEVERQVAPLVHGERCREEDRVALVALDVLEVLDEQPLAAGRRGGHVGVVPVRCAAVEGRDEPVVARVPQHRLDERPLLRVERHDPERRHPPGMRVEPSTDLLDDRLGLDRVGAQEPAGPVLTPG